MTEIQETFPSAKSSACACVNKETLVQSLLPLPRKKRPMPELLHFFPRKKPAPKPPWHKLRSN